MATFVRVCVFVVTVASVVEPFLSPQQRENVSQFQRRPELISGAWIDVMTEKISEKTDKGIPWPEAQLLPLVDIHASAQCIQSLVESSFSSPELGWEVCWSLASYANDSHHSKDFLQTQVHRSTCKFDSLVCQPESTII